MTRGCKGSMHHMLCEQFESWYEGTQSLADPLVTISDRHVLQYCFACNRVHVSHMLNKEQYP